MAGDQFASGSMFEIRMLLTSINKSMAEVAILAIRRPLDGHEGYATLLARIGAYVEIFGRRTVQSVRQRYRTLRPFVRRIDFVRLRFLLRVVVAGLRSNLKNRKQFARHVGDGQPSRVSANREWANVTLPVPCSSARTI